MATLLAGRFESEGASPSGGTSDEKRAQLGDLLRRARELRGLTLEQLSRETKIPQRRLEALEHGNLAASPDAFYRRAEVRAYAQAVNLDQQRALAQLETALEATAAALLPLPDPPEPHRFTVSRTRISLIVIGILAAAGLFARVVGGREPASNQLQARPGSEAPASIALPDRESSPAPATPAVEAAVVPPSPGAAVVEAARAPAPDGRTIASPIEPPVPATASAADVRSDVRSFAESVTELVVLTQPPGASVTVNGVGWGIAPVTIRYLPPGSKLIRVSRDGYAAEERTIALAEGRPVVIEIQLGSVP